MKLNQSIIAEQSIKYLQQHQNARVTAANIFLANHQNNQDQIQFDNSVKAVYESWLNQQVRNDRLSVIMSSGVFDTKSYYLRPHQLEYWARKNWQV